MYKFGSNGGYSMGLSTTYRGGLIKLEKFTSGSNTSHTTYPEASWTNQNMTIKAFPSGDVEGYFDIEAIGAFRTEEQANHFIATYTPEVHKTLPPYTTDNDASTDVDYIIMNADHIKLATGVDGALTTDAEGNKAVMITPEESYVTPENGQVVITPANANAGFADSGENSLYDFGYYTVRYKTTGDALATINTMLSGKLDSTSHYKWRGTQLTSKSDYGFVTIDRDTFTAGNVSGHTSAPVNTWTSQAINLKTFATAEASGALYLQEIAAFRTAEQAADYVENYETYIAEREDAPAYLVLNSSELSSVSSYNSIFTKSDVTDAETEKSFVKFEANTDGTHADGTSFDFATKSLAQGITLKDYPVIKIAYKSKVTATNTKIDFNIGLDYLSVATRIWGPKLSFTRDESVNYLIVNIPNTSFTGGEDLSGTTYSYDSIDNTSTYNYLRFKPFYGGTYAPGDYFAIE